MLFCLFLYFFFFKQKTAYEMRISDWSSDVCSSDLLEVDALARHIEPAVEVRVAGDQFLHLGVGLVDILGIARQRYPAKRPDAAAEQRADIGGHEARKIEGVRDTLVLRHLADVVAVIERRHTRMVKIEHRADLHRSEEHKSELQSLLSNSYAVFCLKKKKKSTTYPH